MYGAEMDHYDLTALKVKVLIVQGRLGAFVVIVQGEMVYL